MNPDVKQKVIEEMKEKLLKGHEEDIKNGYFNILEIFKFEKTVDEVPYFLNCFYESMRLEPPVVISGIWNALEDCTLG